MTINFNLRWLVLLPALFVCKNLFHAALGIPLLFESDIGPALGTGVILYYGACAIGWTLLALLVWFAFRPNNTTVVKSE